MFLLKKIKKYINLILICTCVITIGSILYLSIPKSQTYINESKNRLNRTSTVIIGEMYYPDKNSNSYYFKPIKAITEKETIDEITEILSSIEVNTDPTTMNVPDNSIEFYDATGIKLFELRGWPLYLVIEDEIISIKLSNEHSRELFNLMKIEESKRK